MCVDEIKYGLIAAARGTFKLQAVSLLPDNALQIRANHASGNVASDWHYKESSW